MRLHVSHRPGSSKWFSTHFPFFLIFVYHEVDALRIVAYIMDIVDCAVNLYLKSTISRKGVK